jgi:hypothetical protein
MDNCNQLFDKNFQVPVAFIQVKKGMVIIQNSDSMVKAKRVDEVVIEKFKKPLLVFIIFPDLQIFFL